MSNPSRRKGIACMVHRANMTRHLYSTTVPESYSSAARFLLRYKGIAPALPTSLSPRRLARSRMSQKFMQPVRQSKTWCSHLPAAILLFNVINGETDYTLSGIINVVVGSVPLVWWRRGAGRGAGEYVCGPSLELGLGTEPYFQNIDNAAPGSRTGLFQDLSAWVIYW